MKKIIINSFIKNIKFMNLQITKNKAILHH